MFPMGWLCFQLAMRTFHSPGLAFLELAGIKLNSTVAVLTPAGDVTRRLGVFVAHTCTDYFADLVSVENRIMPQPVVFAEDATGTITRR